MSRKPKISEIDAEKVRQQAADLGHVLSEQATRASEIATSLAEQGKVWATGVAAPRLDKAWRDGVAAAAPKVEAAAEKARPAVDSARDKIVDDYLPRVQKAMHDAAEAAAKESGKKGKAVKAGKAAQKAMATKPKKRGGAGKTLGWVLVGTAAAGTGYLLWRRTQPVDDPWAEEYWEDTTVTTPAPEVSTAPAGVEDAEPAADAETVAAETETAAGATGTSTSPIDSGRGETDVDTTRNA